MFGTGKKKFLVSWLKQQQSRGELPLLWLVEETNLPTTVKAESAFAWTDGVNVPPLMYDRSGEPGAA